MISSGQTFPFRIEDDPRLSIQHECIGEDLWELSITAVENYEGQIELGLQVASDEGEPWWCVPGCFYGQGCEDTAVPVPRWGRKADGWIQPYWQMAGDRIPYPLVAVLLEGQWSAAWADPHYQLFDLNGEVLEQTPEFWGDVEPQMGFGFGLKENDYQLSLHVPANEGPKVLRRQPDSDASDKKIKLNAGMSISFQCGIWRKSIDDSKDRRGIHELIRENHHMLRATQDKPAATPHGITMENATHGLLAWHWVEEPGYLAYTAAYDRCQEFNANLGGKTLGWAFEASGFIGAMQAAFGLLWQSQQPGGDPEGERIALKMMRRWCQDGMAPNGLFRGSFHPGKAWSASGLLDNPAPLGSQNNDPTGETPFYGSCWLGNQDLLHARTAADATLYLARIAALLGPDHDFYETARACVKSCVIAAMKFQDLTGSYGFIYDLAKDEVKEGEGEAGLWWLPAFGEAYDLFTDDADFQTQMLSSMKLAGAFYASIHKERCSAGAPEDTRLSITSESPQAGVMGYRHLHRLDTQGDWLEAWKDSADWLLSFQKVSNVRFSPYSLLSGQGFKTFGTQYASTQNNQPHCYGLQCIGDLIRLSRVLEDPYYEIRAHEHANFSWQMLSRAAGHWGGQRGMCTEQFYICDWSIFDRWDPGPNHVQKGTLMGSSHTWCIAFQLLSLEQLESVDQLSLKD